MHFILLRLLLNTFIVVQLLNWTWPKQIYKKHMESYITALKQDVTPWERGMLHMLSTVVLSFDFLKSLQCFVMPSKIWTNHSCFLFLFFHSEVHERSHAICEKRFSSGRDWMGDASTRISSARQPPLCNAPQPAFAVTAGRLQIHPAQNVLRHAGYDHPWSRKQVNVPLRNTRDLENACHSNISR